MECEKYYILCAKRRIGNESSGSGNSEKGSNIFGER